MLDWRKYTEIKELLKGVFSEKYYFDHGYHHIIVEPKDFFKSLGLLVNEMGFEFLTTKVEIDLTQNQQLPKWSNKSKDIIYHFYNLDSQQRLQFHLILADDDVMPLVENGIQHFDFLNYKTEKDFHVSTSESKIRDFFNTDFVGPNLIKSPPVKSLYQRYYFDLNHSITQQQYELMVATFEGKIKEVEVINGFWDHPSQINKKNIHPNHVFHLYKNQFVEDPANLEIGWAKTLEDYFLWDIPERAQAIRMVFLELARIQNHLSFLAKIAKNLNASLSWKLILEMRSDLKKIIFFYSKKNHESSLCFFGGVPFDLPHGWIQDCLSLLKKIENNLLVWNREIGLNPLTRNQMRFGKLESNEALKLGLTGPNLRASGIVLDFRKSKPYYFYNDVTFDIPIGRLGDSFDRCLVRLEECFQSIKIINQVIDNLPLGDLRIEINGLDELNQNKIEIIQWSDWSQRVSRFLNSQFTGIESVNGEVCFYANFDFEKPKVTSLKIKNNGLSILNAIQPILVNSPLSSLETILLSIDFNALTVENI